MYIFISGLIGLGELLGKYLEVSVALNRGFKMFGGFLADFEAKCSFGFV